MSRTRKLGVGLGAVLVMAAVAAITAWAVLTVLKTTATDQATAKSIGNVSIGTAETVGLFNATLADIEPGYTVSECTAALVQNKQTGDTPKTWFGGTPGPLADDLQIVIEQRANIDNTGNDPACAMGDLAKPFVQVYSGSLANLIATHGSYANGIAWPATGNGQHLKVTLTLPAAVDPLSVAGQSSGPFAGNFENRSGA